MSSITRWKAQSLQLHRHLTGPHSNAAKLGLLPLFAHIAYRISASAAAVAGMAKKAWRDNNPSTLDLEKVRALRQQINAAFDQLEETIAQRIDHTPSALTAATAPAAEAAYAAHGNLALLALALMEEAGELAEPLMSVAAGQQSLAQALPSISAESADLRIYLHIASERAGVCPETSTTAKWAIVQTRYPASAFLPVPRISLRDAHSAQMSLLPPDDPAQESHSE